MALYCEKCGAFFEFSQRYKHQCKKEDIAEILEEKLEKMANMKGGFN